MDYDRALIGHIITKKSLQDAIQLGVTADMLSEEARVYWDFLHSHYTRFREVPSLPYFQDHFPGYEHDVPADSLEVLVHNLKSILLAKDLDEVSRQTAEMAFVDPWEARSRLLARVSEIASRHQQDDTDLIAGDNSEEIKGLVQRARETGGVLGHPWPWALLNRHTPGIDKGHFVYFYGPEKSKKSWLMVYLADFFEDQGLRVAVHTREMSRQEFSLRLYAMRAQLDWDEDLTQGKITTNGEQALEAVMRGFKERRRILFTEIGEGIAGMQAKREQFRPHIIIHDYMKALADDAMAGKNVRPGQEHSFVAAAADQIASYGKSTGIPIIAVGHTNADEAKLQGRSTQDAAHSKHIARRLDYMFRIVNDEYHNRLGLILVAGRHARKFLGLTISGHLCRGFGEVIEENAEWVKDFDVVKGSEEEAKKRKPEVKTTGATSVISASAFATTARKT